MPDNNSTFFAVAGACAAAIDRIMEIINHFAFTQVAIYGYSFVKAGKECWTLIQDVGLMPLLNNFLVQAVGWLGALAGGSLCAVGGMMLVKSTNLDGTFPMWLAGMYCGIIGFAMVLPTVEVVESMVTALFICYANNPDVLLLNNPTLYNEIDSAYMRMVGESGNDEEGDGEEWDEEQENEEWGEEQYEASSEDVGDASKHKKKP